MKFYNILISNRYRYVYNTTFLLEKRTRPALLPSQRTANRCITSCTLDCQLQALADGPCCHPLRPKGEIPLAASGETHHRISGRTMTRRSAHAGKGLENIKICHYVSGNGRIRKAAYSDALPLQCLPKHGGRDRPPSVPRQARSHTGTARRGMFPVSFTNTLKNI